MPLNMLSLFSGIGGMDLAAQWAGIETIAFCEIEPFCQKVLRKNFGEDIIIYDDVRTLTAKSLQQRGVSPKSISVVAGGFPCQDISFANPNGKGLDGDRSGLWREFHRIICELRPHYVVVENVSNLLRRGMGRVLRDLASSGYDAEWSVLSACAMGAPHARERVLILAYPSRKLWNGPTLHGVRSEQGMGATGKLRGRYLEAVRQGSSWVLDESPLCRAVDGVSDGKHRLKSLGNAVVPQDVYPIFEAIARNELII